MTESDIESLCIPMRPDLQCTRPGQVAGRLHDAGIGGTVFGTDPPPSRCAALAERIEWTAMSEQDGECLVSCDMGELGGFVASFSPDATSPRQGRCAGLHVVTAFLDLDGVTLVFRRDLWQRECAGSGSVGRLVREKVGWAVEPIATLDGEPLSYTREGHTVVVELVCPNWYALDHPGDWQRRRVRIDAHRLEPL
jgi:hypothetical protein